MCYEEFCVFLFLILICGLEGKFGELFFFLFCDVNLVILFCVDGLLYKLDIDGVMGEIVNFLVLEVWFGVLLLLLFLELFDFFLEIWIIVGSLLYWLDL